MAEDSIKKLLETLGKLKVAYGNTNNPNAKVQSLIETSETQIQKHLQATEEAQTEMDVEVIKGAGEAMKNTVAMIGAAKDGDWFAFTESALQVVAKTAVVLGTLAGPEGMIVGTIIASVCEVVSSIIALFKPKEKSIVSQIREVIVEELKRYEYNEVTKRRVQGWCQVESSIIQELSFHHQKLVETGRSSYCGFDSQRLDNERELMGEILFLANEQFAYLAEEARYDANEKRSADKCLSCIGGYSSIASYYLLILSWQKILCCTHAQMNKSDDVFFKEQVEFLDMVINVTKQNARNFLGFLSDEGYLGPAGWWLGKLRVMKEYRETPYIFAAVELFRKQIGCDPVTYTTAAADSMLKKCCSEEIAVSQLHPELSWSNDGYALLNAGKKNDYLEITNQTRWPLCVFSGLCGHYPNELQFAVDPYKTGVESANGKRDHSKVSSGGMIVLGECSKTLNDFTRDVQFIEFVISNCKPFKISTNPVSKFSMESLEETTRKASSNGDGGNLFEFHDEILFVRGKIDDQIKEYCVFKIIIEEFDESKLIEKTKGKPA